MATNNIKQFTNYDFILDEKNIKSIKVGNEILSVFYQKKEFSRYVTKLGYNCSPNGIGIPIFLTDELGQKEFIIGKTGIFEFQPIIIQLEDKELGGLIEKNVELAIKAIEVPLAIKQENENIFINFIINYVEGEEIKKEN